MKSGSFTIIMVALAVVCVAAWQWATVTANYDGNWTALYCTGADMPHPDLVASEHIFVFPNSTGYDGQMYHYMAHDPLMRSDLKAYVDDTRLRYHRILVPGLAYVLALGHFHWIDPAYEIVFLLTIGLGVYWSCRVTQSAWGLAFLLIPAIPISIDRLVVDGALATLTVGFVYYRHGPTWKLFLVLMCAALTRDTGFLLIAAACLAHLLQRRYRLTAILAASAAPAAAWYAYVQTQTPKSNYVFSLIPFANVVQALANPWRYPAGTSFPGAIVAADYLAQAGVLIALGMAVYLIVRKPTGQLQIASVLFAAFAAVLLRYDQWQIIYDLVRLVSPLLVCLAAVASIERKPWLLAPVAMILPRIAMQFAPQVLGMIKSW
jgi:hypothetical protein